MSFFSSLHLIRSHTPDTACAADMAVARSRGGNTTLQAQRGIGLVGFIVGIVVGLAVALAVAVYITKVPTPFTDKSKAKTAEEQAEEEARLKSWNPNAPLASKTPSASGHVQPAPTAPPQATAPVASDPTAQAPGTPDEPAVLGDRE